MKKRNDDLMAQLGDPLPLPYMTESSSGRSGTISKVRKELPVQLWSDDSNIDSEVLYRPGPRPEPRPEPERDHKHKNYIHLNKLRPNPVRRRFMEPAESDVIGSIENKLDYIKELTEMNRLSSTDLMYLKDIQYQLETILIHERQQDTNQTRELSNGSESQSSSRVPSNSHVNFDSNHHSFDPPIDISIIDELERLKRTQKKWPQINLKMFIICLLCTILFLITSYLVSDLSYEYCYYIC